MTKKIIIMIGPAGSGKGTQNKLIEKNFGYRPFSMGEILREETNKKTKLGKKINQIISKGQLVPLEISCDLIFTRIKKEKAHEILIDGFPREYDQAVIFDYFLHLNNFMLVGVIHLNIPKTESIKRLLLRKRCDDTKKAIKKRLEDYENITKKVINRYKHQKKLIEINGNKSIENVFKEIKRKLKENKT